MKIKDKNFEILHSQEKIISIVNSISTQMNKDLSDKDVIFLGILNGSFMFASDLLKNINFNVEISFLKIASYQGTSSTGNVQRLIGINEDIKDKTVVIIEDIVESGNTLESIIKQLNGYEPKEIKIATLLFKPKTYLKTIPIDYIGFEISDEFIVGYGLDYDGHGRNYKDIYQNI